MKRLRCLAAITLLLLSASAAFSGHSEREATTGSKPEAVRALWGVGGPANQAACSIAVAVSLLQNFHPSATASAEQWNELLEDLMGEVVRAPSESAISVAAIERLNALAPAVVFHDRGHGPTRATFESFENPSPTEVWGLERRGLAREFGGTSGIYWARRVSVPRPDGQPSSPSFWTERLPNGQVMSFPTISDDTPRSAPKESAAQSVGAPPPIEGKALWLANIAATWSAVRHFYPYEDALSMPWPDLLSQAMARAGDARDTREADLAVAWMLAQLRDGHAGVTRSGAYNGYLPFLARFLDGELIITAVASDSKLQPGDRVLKIAGRPVPELVGEAKEYISAATEGWKLVRVVRKLLIGRVGELAVVEVERNGETVATTQTVIPAGDWIALREFDAPPIRELSDSILYVDLRRVGQDDFDRELPRIAAAPRVVFDLRGYPRLAVTIVAHLGGGTVLTPQMSIPYLRSPGDSGRSFVDASWQIESKEPRIRGEVVFLADENAMSAAETILEMVRGNHLARIVGSRTAGTNGNVVRGKLPDGALSITFTGMLVETVNGETFHGVGIEPDLVVRPTRAGFSAGHDEVLAAAIGLLARRQAK